MTKDSLWAGFSRTSQKSTLTKNQNNLSSRQKKENGINSQESYSIPNTHKNYRDFRLKITHSHSVPKHYFLPNGIKRQQLRNNFETSPVNGQLYKSYKQKTNKKIRFPAKLYLNVSTYSIYFIYLFFLVQSSEAAGNSISSITTDESTITGVSATTGCICPPTSTQPLHETTNMGTTPGSTTTTNGCICPNIKSEEESPKTSTPSGLSSLSEVETSTQLPVIQKRRKRRQEDDLDLSVDDFDQKLMKKMPFAKYV